jgi:hypothetical protein
MVEAATQPLAQATADHLATIVLDRFGRDNSTPA